MPFGAATVTSFFPFTRYGSAERLCSTAASRRNFASAPENSAFTQTAYFCFTRAVTSPGAAACQLFPASTEIESFPSPSKAASIWPLT